MSAPPLPGCLRRLRRDEAGSGTLEFALFTPLILGFFLSGFELGMLLLRQMMLDHGLDVAVREVRLGTFTGDDVHQQIKDMVCERAAVIPDCDERLTLAMTVVNPRACVVFEPFMPLNGLGFELLHDDQGRRVSRTYALVSESAYAVEPN